MVKFKKFIAVLLIGILFISVPPTGLVVKAVEYNASFSREVAAQSMVLLKNNNNVLPLSGNVAVFGSNQTSYIKGGSGSGNTHVRATVGLQQGLQNNPKINVVTKLSKNNITQAEADAAAQTADTAIIAIGRGGGEDNDLSAGSGYYTLTADEQGMVKNVCDAFDKVVVVLNTAGVTDSSWYASNQKIQAVLWAGLAGMEGGNAMADILSGDVNPSGKTVDTFAKSLSDYPSQNFGGSPVTYTEDIYVGYRYFETIPSAKDKVNYEFGYGLSYTTFSINPGSVTESNGVISVPVTVKNTGSRSGKEVVQLYYSAPSGKLGKAARELGAFAKTEELAPKESQTIILKLAVGDMASYDDIGLTGATNKSCYVLEAGDYKLHLGNSVRNTQELTYQYKVSSLRVTERLSQQAAPKMQLNLMQADGTSKTVLPQATANGAMGAKPTLTTTKSGIKLEDVYKGRETLDDFVAQMSNTELVSISTGQPRKGAPNTGGIGNNLDKYGIPNIQTADGPAGIRMEDDCTSTAWPVGTMLACTWDVDLIERVGEKMGEECNAFNVDVLLSPGMNLHRNPRGGRNFEYYSEDPYLTGKIGAAFTKGVQSKNVAAAIKHFAANEQEGSRFTVDTRLSERALREIYLKGFEICVKEAEPWTVMSSYNYINGRETAENYDLLTSILRDEWGFSGLVMTDWNNDTRQDEEVLAGNNVRMPKPNNNQSAHYLDAALANDKITRGQLQYNVKQILGAIVKVNNFQKMVNPVYTPINRMTTLKLADNILDSSSSKTLDQYSTSDRSIAHLDRKDLPKQTERYLGYANAGQWVTYNVDVKKSGTYELSAVVASANGQGKMTLTFGNKTPFTVSAINTGSNTTFGKTPVQTVHLDAGEQVIRIDITQSGMGIYSLDFAITQADDGTVIKDALQIAYDQNKDIKQDLYTDVTYEAYLAKLQSAAAILAEDNTATQETVNSTRTALLAAVSNLATDSIITPAANVALNKSAGAVCSVGVSAANPIANGLNGARSNTRFETINSFTYYGKTPDYNGSHPDIFSFPMTLTIDLQAQYTVEEIMIFWEADSSCATAFTIEVSTDKLSWTAITNEENGNKDWSTQYDDPQDARYIRLSCTAKNGQWGYSFWSFEVYGRPTGSVNKNNLLKLYNNNKRLVATDYVAGFADLAPALNAAKGVLDNSAATKAQIDAAVANLQTAIGGLKKSANKTQLQALYDANKLKANDNYTNNTWNTLQNALNKAKEVLDDVNATQDEADGAKTALQTALDSLKTKANKTALQTLYDANKNKTNDNYDAKSWTAFQTALSDARTVLDLDNATQNQVDTAKIDLQTALDGLKKSVNKAALQALYNANKEKVNNNTADSWAAFQAALRAARVVLDNDNATQSQIDTARAQLQTAINGLKTVMPNKPSAPKAKMKSKSSIQVSWSKVSGVSGYEIQRSTSKSGAFKTVKTITSGSTISYNNTGLSSAQTYYYRIRAYQVSGVQKSYSGYTSAVYATTKPAAVSGLKVVKYGSNAVKVSWKKVTRGSGYEVSRATKRSSGFKKVASLGSGKTSFKNSSLKKGTTYYYKVRAYKKVNGKKIYGGYAKVVKVKR